MSSDDAETSNFLASMSIVEESDTQKNQVVNTTNENVSATTSSNDDSDASTYDYLRQLPPDQLKAHLLISGYTPAQIIIYMNQLEAETKRQARFNGKAASEHKFWNTQPVIHDEEPVTVNGPIEVKTIDDVRKEPLNMPKGYEWCNINVHNPEEAKEMYTLLSENYVEDDHCRFRFDYSPEFLAWALTPPGYFPDWIVGVRVSKTKKLMGCITGIPASIKVDDKIVKMAEINYLCVHKKLRDQRLAPVLIKEITRRVNCQSIWQATYTAGVVLPKPVARCRYYHRIISAKKMVESGFSFVPEKSTLASYIRGLRLPPKPSHQWITMTEEHTESAFNLLTSYLETHSKLHMVFHLEEFKHVFLARKEVVHSFVMINEKGDVSDFASYYFLPSSIIGNPLHSKMMAIYSYYNVPTSMTYQELIEDILILAREHGADVFNCLDLMENMKFIEPLKFGMGDGFLQYYLYNWQSPEKNPSEVGLVLL